VGAAADSYVQLALLHAQENAKSFDEVRRWGGEAVGDGLLTAAGRLLRSVVQLCRSGSAARCKAHRAPDMN